jgi:primosomal protein N' (replication factor Y)
MFYYEVLVSSQRYHGDSALTYSSADEIAVGAVVLVPLQRQTVLGIVTKNVPQPKFTTKPISKTVVAQPVPHALIDLHDWLHTYYPSPIGMVTQLFLPASLSRQARHKADTKLPTSAPITPPVLTHEQQDVIKKINNTTQRTILLHGDTGTGKTRVYLELTTQAFANHKSALIMTPEIGLTPQLSASFERTFPGKVITIHSTLTDAERRDAWLRIHTTDEPIVVIGPRSALFSPLKNVGIIVMDESHDTAYKQEQMPYYQTSRVAAKLAELHDAKLIMGTATPLVSDYYTLAQKRLPILRMLTKAVASDHEETKITVINLRDQTHFSRSAWISNELVSAINTAMRSSQQALVFLNRRGTARLVLCQICGWQATCPRCDLPLTYHGDQHYVRCHTCGYQKHAPSSCEKCGSADIVFRSIGTKSLVNELQRLFPKARIARYDSDNAKAERLDQQYEAVRAGSVDIIVGTQMLTKGLDLPKLSVVGVVVADTALYFPDYTAEERSYQMLSQVAGRVGRGHQTGTVIIQTYHPENVNLHAALQKDYQSFYEQQLREREHYHFPPFYHTLKLVCDRAGSSTAKKAASSLLNTLRTQNLFIEIIGPSPAFIEKANNRYYWQIIVKAKNRSELVKVIQLLPANWNYDLDPTNLL